MRWQNSETTPLARDGNDTSTGESAGALPPSTACPHVTFTPLPALSPVHQRGARGVGKPVTGPQAPRHGAKAKGPRSERKTTPPRRVEGLEPAPALAAPGRTVRTREWAPDTLGRKQNKEVGAPDEARAILTNSQYTATTPGS